MSAGEGWQPTRSLADTTGDLTRTTGVLLAGAAPGEPAGNSVSTEVLLAALRAEGPVGLLTHRTSPVPRLRQGTFEAVPTMELGVQPWSVHGEAALASWLYRDRVREFSCGWAVNSRYAQSLLAAGVPYVIWEPTTLRDELESISVSAVRHSGRGTGLGTLLHKALLPLDEHLERLLYRSAIAVLAMSEYTAEQIRSRHRLPDAKVRVLQHPPTLRFLQALDRRRQQARPHDDRSDEAGNADRIIRLLFVGRVDDPRKNFDLLRDAFVRLRDAGLPATLTVIGAHGESWRRARDSVGEIRFAGRVDENALADALFLHDILVVSSRQEGYGIVVSEAMHAGLPVVSTRCGGPEQVLRESGAGLLVDHSATALAEGIGRVARDTALRAALGGRGWTYAQRELSPTRFQQRVAEELRLLHAAAGAIAA